MSGERCSEIDYALRQWVVCYGFILWCFTNNVFAFLVDFDCIGKEDGDYANPKKTCDRIYYSCSGEVASERQCADGSFFDSELLLCDEFENVPDCTGHARVLTTTPEPRDLPGKLFIKFIRILSKFNRLYLCFSLFFRLFSKSWRHLSCRRLQWWLLGVCWWHDIGNQMPRGFVLRRRIDVVRKERIHPIVRRCSTHSLTVGWDFRIINR